MKILCQVWTGRVIYLAGRIIFFFFHLYFRFLSAVLDPGMLGFRRLDSALPLWTVDLEADAALIFPTWEYVAIVLKRLEAASRGQLGDCRNQRLRLRRVDPHPSCLESQSLTPKRTVFSTSWPSTIVGVQGSFYRIVIKGCESCCFYETLVSYLIDSPPSLCYVVCQPIPHCDASMGIISSPPTPTTPNLALPYTKLKGTNNHNYWWFGLFSTFKGQKLQSCNALRFASVSVLSRSNSRDLFSAFVRLTRAPPSITQCKESTIN